MPAQISRLEVGLQLILITLSSEQCTLNCKSSIETSLTLFILNPHSSKELQKSQVFIQNTILLEAYLCLQGSPEAKYNLNRSSKHVVSI